MAISIILIGVGKISKYIIRNRNKKTPLCNEEEISKIEDKDNKNIEEIEEDDKHMREMFSQKGSIFLMIFLFLAFIFIIIYISRRFF